MKKINNKKNMNILTILTICFLISSISYTQINSAKENPTTLSLQNSAPYLANLRAYIVEPTSRYIMSGDEPYHYGFLDFAINQEISVDYLSSITIDATWDPEQAGFQNVEEQNIMVVASAYNFQTGYIDAAAAAFPGQTTSNNVPEFTHTVIIEKATAAHCGFCPDMAYTIEQIYQSNDYPFYYVSLVNDKNPTARSIVREYQVGSFPTAIFDGGRYRINNAYADESEFRDYIESCGQEDVHLLDFSLSVQWNADDTISVSVTILNKEQIINEQPEKPTLTGPTTGKADKYYPYSVYSTDADGDDLSYQFDWGDDTESKWEGPYKSGQTVEIIKKWEETGNYQVRVRAKDIKGTPSEWSDPLPVQMPHNYIFEQNGLFYKILQAFQRYFSLENTWLYNILEKI